MQTRYARLGDAEIAYRVIGDGPRDIVYCAPYASNLDALWELPEHVDFVESLMRLGRVVAFDKRGTGLSDRGLEGASIEQRAQDVVAVMDAAHSAQAVLFGTMDAGAASLVTAALFPDRVTGVIACEVVASADPGVEQPWGREANWAETLLAAPDAPDGGRDVIGRVLGPDVAADPRLLNWVTRSWAMAANPRAIARLLEAALKVDIRPYLARVAAPCSCCTIPRATW